MTARAMIRNPYTYVLLCQQQSKYSIGRKHTNTRARWNPEIQSSAPKIVIIMTPGGRIVIKRPRMRQIPRYHYQQQQHHHHHYRSRPAVAASLQYVAAQTHVCKAVVCLAARLLSVRKLCVASTICFNSVHYTTYRRRRRLRRRLSADNARDPLKIMISQNSCFNNKLFFLSSSLY